MHGEREKWKKRKMYRREIAEKGIVDAWNRVVRLVRRWVVAEVEKERKKTFATVRSRIHERESKASRSTRHQDWCGTSHTPTQSEAYRFHSWRRKRSNQSRSKSKKRSNRNDGGETKERERP